MNTARPLYSTPEQRALNAIMRLPFGLQRECLGLALNGANTPEEYAKVQRLAESIVPPAAD